MPAPVPLSHAYRLINHGPTVLVSSAHGGRRNVMAAAWSTAVDFDPPKVLVVIGQATFTRELVEASGEFALNLPPRALLAATVGVGSVSGREVPDKAERFGLRTFAASRIAAPLIEGCVGWLECRLLPEPHLQQAYDICLGEVVAAWADERVFSGGRWHFEDAPAELRTLHHVAGGHFYAIGDAVEAGGSDT
jgi:flavin reductase (DIM6/NTAB) family NADH-FMN oxidoreductase RutF